MQFWLIERFYGTFLLKLLAILVHRALLWHFSIAFACKFWFIERFYGTFLLHLLAVLAHRVILWHLSIEIACSFGSLSVSMALFY